MIQKKKGIQSKYPPLQPGQRSVGVNDSDGYGGIRNVAVTTPNGTRIVRKWVGPDGRIRQDDSDSDPLDAPDTVASTFPIYTVFADEIPAIDLTRHAVIQTHEYLCVFDHKRKQPYYVAYTIKRGDFETENVLSRNFVVPKAGKGMVIPATLYAGNDYDVGHLIALASKKASRYAYEVNWMFCVAAQNKNLNRGPFLKMENYLRVLANEGKELRVIVACVFGGGQKPMQRAVDRGYQHEVPSSFVVLVEYDDDTREAWTFPQTAARNDELTKFETDWAVARRSISDKWWRSLSL